MDLIHQGQGFGGVAQRLLAHNMDPNALRPWIGNDGRTYINVQTGRLDKNGLPEYRAQVTNAPGTLRRDEWKFIDDMVMKAVQFPLRAVADLQSAGLVTSIPNGMGKTVYEYERQSDISPAMISMDGIREGDSDRPEYDLAGLPLPIIHKDFQFSARQVAVSRNGNTPLDMSSVELAGRKIAEEMERLLLGLRTYQYAGYQVYGYTTFPQRLTMELTAPTDDNHEVTVLEVLNMRKKSVDNGYMGPWKLYVSPLWDIFLDNDYKISGGNNPNQTLRQRLMGINGITGIETLFYLQDAQMLLVQMDSAVVKLINAIPVTTVQWEELGGMRIHYKILASLTPLLRADYYGRTGIVQGVADGYGAEVPA